LKTIPISRPGAGPEPTTNASVEAAKATRERVIAKLSTPPQDSPISVNPNNVSVEELSAINGQNTTPETSEQQEAVTPVEQPKASEPSQPSQLAILARKERALRAKVQQQEQAFKAKEAELLQKQAEFDNKVREYEQGYISKAQLKQDTLRILADEGVSYDELTQQLINQQPSNPRVEAQIGRLEQTITQLQKKLEAQEKAGQEQQTQSYQAALRQIETDVRSLVKSDPEFEMVKATRSEKDVVELIEKTFQEENRVMDVVEATALVEDYLVEEATKLTRIDKIKKRLNLSVEKSTQGQKQQPNQKQQQPMKTLTNAVSSTKKLSSRDRAIAAMEGRLRS
jgi:hypothetical protein